MWLLVLAGVAIASVLFGDDDEPPPKAEEKKLEEKPAAKPTPEPAS